MYSKKLEIWKSGKTFIKKNLSAYTNVQYSLSLKYLSNLQIKSTYIIQSTLYHPKPLL